SNSGKRRPRPCRHRRLLRPSCPRPTSRSRTASWPLARHWNRDSTPGRPPPCRATTRPLRHPTCPSSAWARPPTCPTCNSVGNAVPLYLRVAHERSDARKKLLREKPEEWNKLPLEKLPLAEVKQFLEGYSYNLRQLELGARRATAEWEYTLDAGDPIGLLLPD